MPFDHHPQPWLRATFLVDGPSGRNYLPGFARFEFGVYDYKFFDPATRRTRIVTRLLHLESGVIFGDFADLELAKVAGTLADRHIEYDFHLMDERERSDEFAGVVEIWQAAGLTLTPEYQSSVALWDRSPSRAELQPAAGKISWPKWETRQHAT